MAASLKEFFLPEAGVPQFREKTKSKKSTHFKPKDHDKEESDERERMRSKRISASEEPGIKYPGDEDDDGDDDLGPDLDYDDPSPGDDWDEDEETAKAFGDTVSGNEKELNKLFSTEPEEEKPGKFASKSMPPSKALQGGKAGLTLNGDKKTLGALQKALEALRTKDEDLADWVDDCISAISAAARKGSSEVTLPKFEATPSLDGFDDATGGDDEDY